MSVHGDSDHLSVRYEGPKIIPINDEPISAAASVAQAERP